MPQIQKGAMSGTCVGGYYYDLGGAHSKYRSKSLDEFAYRLLDIGMAQVNVTMTNDGQDVERKYLEELGFKEVFKTGYMHVHVTDSKALELALSPFRAKRQKALEEEQARKREEAKRKAQQEKERHERLAKEKAERVEKQLKTLVRIESNTDWTLEQLRTYYTQFSEIRIKQLFDTTFGFTQFPEYEREFDDGAILISINSRLRKRRERDGEVTKEKKVTKKRASKAEG